jgi:subtilase family serine protease
MVDSALEIVESDETNNNCTSTATIKIVVHDIAVVSQVPNPTEVFQAES